MPNQIITDLNNAEKLSEWMYFRSGVAVWSSDNLSNPCGQWLAPADKTERPNWQTRTKPDYIVTDPSLVLLKVYVEVHRFKIAIRRGQNGMHMKLTPTSSKRVNKQLKKYGKESRYVFDYETQECIIEIPTDTVTLARYMEQNNGTL